MYFKIKTYQCGRSLRPYKKKTVIKRSRGALSKPGDRDDFSSLRLGDADVAMP